MRNPGEAGTAVTDDTSQILSKYSDSLTADD